MTDSSNTGSSDTEHTEAHHTHEGVEPDGTFTDSETENGNTTVEHGAEHSASGEFTDTDFSSEADDRD